MESNTNILIYHSFSTTVSYPNAVHFKCSTSENQPNKPSQFLLNNTGMTILRSTGIRYSTYIVKSVIMS